MPNIKLKDRLNHEVVYEGVNEMTVPNADGTGIVTFTIPEGNKEITNTASTDVSAYATAQIVDANLIAKNIAKDVTVLGITGTHQGGIIPAGNIELNSSATAQTGIDVTNYATASVTAMPVSPLDNTIISGSAYEEATGDYAWRSTVQIPAGYHEGQTLTKDFSEIFPAPTTEGTADKMLLGYELFNHEGKKITGTMANNATTATKLDTTTTSYTVPAGYHTGSDTVSITTETKTATANGDVTPTAGKVLSKVTVAIPVYNGEIS